MAQRINFKPKNITKSITRRILRMAARNSKTFRNVLLKANAYNEKREIKGGVKVKKGIYGKKSKENKGYSRRTSSIRISIRKGRSGKHFGVGINGDVSPKGQ